jgi:tRNA G18 (ribose-2'-O)-methylase SpoU
VRFEITDPDDPRIDVFVGLRDHVLRQVREQPGGDMASYFIAEGDIVIERALRAGYHLASILIDGKRTRPLPQPVSDDIPVFSCAPNVLQRVTGYHLHRGALACFHRRPVATAAEVLDQSVTTVLVCEGINNPTNMGVILRCAVALGVEAFLLDPTCADPLYRRSGRVSMGEAFALPYARLGQFPEGLDLLCDRGFRLLALTPTADAADLGELRIEPGEPVAILLGAEGPGLTPRTLERVEERVRIPMSGNVDSINVGSAAAVAFWAIQEARRRGSD